MWVCRNVIGTTHQIDGWNPIHKDGDDWGMGYEIAIPTLQCRYKKIYSDLLPLLINTITTLI